MTEEQKKSSLGGKREGAGRKPTGTEDVKIRLTPEQHQKLIALGGSAYLQQYLDNLNPNKVFSVNLTKRQQWLVDALGDPWIESERKKLLDYNDDRCTGYTFSGNELTITNESLDGFQFSVEYQGENIPVTDDISKEDLDDDDEYNKTRFNTKEEALAYLDEWIAKPGLNEATIEDLQHMKDLIIAHQGVKHMSEAEWFGNALKELEEQSRLPVFFFDLTKNTCRLVDMLDFGHALNKYALTYDELASILRARVPSTANDESVRVAFSSCPEALQFTLENRAKFSDEDFYRTQRRILTWFDNESAV